MLGARTEKCRTFRKWVTGTVLPSIRGNGGFIEASATPTESERQCVEIIIVDGEPHFELYSTKMPLGYSRIVTAKGREYIQVRKI